MENNPIVAGYTDSAQFFWKFLSAKEDLLFFFYRFFEDYCLAPYTRAHKHTVKNQI